MAYRFSSSTDVVEFAVSPFTGYAFGPLTLAAYVKRTTVTSGNRCVATFDDSTLGTLLANWLFNSADNPRQALGGIGGSSGPQTVSNTSLWYLVVWTWAGAGNAVRTHVHDGTSWNHNNGGSLASNLAALLSSDRLRVGTSGAPGGTTAFAGDIVCVGLKKTTSADLTVETLSRTAFTAWTAFGFEWLIGFDSSFLSAGKLQDQGTVGTGDELSRTGTSAVSDPAGWSWAAAAPSGTFTKVKWGTGLAVTDEGSGTIRVDSSSSTPPDATTTSKGIVQLAGDLTGTAASPQIAAGVITDLEVAAANKDGIATLASLRTLGTGAAQAAPGNDTRFLPTDTVVVAGTRILANKLVGTDTYPAFRLFGDGKLEWGQGGTTAPDTNLYRRGATVLGGSSFRGDADLGANWGTANQIWIGHDGGALAPRIIFGSGFDAVLYRPTGGGLQTDGTMQAAGSLVASTAGAGHVYIRNNTGHIYFGLSDDTNLYRLAQDNLASDDNLIARQTGATRIALGDVIGGGQAGLVFGTNADTNLYRDAQNSLFTSGLFKINGSGAGVSSPTAAGLLLNWPTIGTRWLEMGPADSAGAGYRSVRITN